MQYHSRLLIDIHTMTVMNSGEHALHPRIARDIDYTFSAIRRNKVVAAKAIATPMSGPNKRDMDKYYQTMSKLRVQVHDFTTLVRDGLLTVGLQVLTHSKSNWLMLDTEMYLHAEDGYGITIWSIDRSHYFAMVDIDSYYYLPTPLKAYGCEGMPYYTIQGVVNAIGTINRVVKEFEQCKPCHYSDYNGDYCGLGIIPIGMCGHYQPCRP